MKKITIDTLMDLKFISAFSANPSRNKAAFVLRSVDEKENTYLANLWLLENGKTRRLSGLDKESNYIWLNDEAVLFAAKRSDTEKKREEAGEVFTSYYRLNLNGGEAEKFFELPLAVSSIVALQNDFFLLTASVDPLQPDLCFASEEVRKEAVQKAKDFSFRYHFKEIPFCHNGGGFQEEARNRLYLYDARVKKLHAISAPYFNCDGIYPSEDRMRVYFSGIEYQGKADVVNRLYRLTLPEREKLSETGNLWNEAVQCLYDQDDCDLQCAWETKPELGSASPLFVLANNHTRYTLNQTPDLFEYQADSRSLKLLQEEVKWYHSVGSDCRFGGSANYELDHGTIRFLVGVKAHGYVAEISPSGELKTVFAYPGAVDGVARIGTELFGYGLFNHKPQEIYRLIPATAEKEAGVERLSDFNFSLISDYALAPQLRLNYKSTAGVEGWVVLPPDFDANKTYPAILDIHGGPRTVYGEVFFHEMQYWAAKGFIVFFCNPRGSDGHGDAFADIRGKYGTVDYEDIMEFTDAVLAQYPCIDQKRVGVTGGSYGGFMTNWIIGHTDRFAAAATQRSIMNWLSFYGTSDIGYYFATDQCGCGTASEADFMKLWEHSPLRYVNNVKTPTLIIHSDADYRCPVEQAYQLLTALKDRGIDCEMYQFKGENHELSRSGKPKARRERLTQITQWMERYLNPEENRIEG